MGKNNDTPIDRARDELFSHIQRCGVLSASPEDQQEWLKDTMDYVSDRYPMLSDLQVASIEVMGRRYMAPVIPHGRGINARNRDQWSADQIEETPSADAVEVPAGELEESASGVGATDGGL